MPLKIAYQGEPGANSHIACIEAYPGYEPLPCGTFEDAFQAVTEGEAALAMIPIDNSVAGRVADIHHLLPRSNLYIIGEHFLPVHHQLMIVPGADKAGIRTVHSHVHALGQCRKVIRENIEDESHNTTRFVVLSATQRDAGPEEGPVMTTFVFRVRNVPAALYKAMGGFATNGVNMTKLESYQIEGQFSATQFYADIEGHPSERNVRLAMEELEFFTSYLRVLGVYKSSPHRAEIAKRIGKD